MKKTAALLLLTMALAFAGCGSSGDTSEKTDKTEQKTDNSGNTSTEEVAVLEADTQTVSKSEALSDGILTVGTNAEFPPFEFLGDDGEPDGFDVALIKAIGEKLGVEVQIENMEFDSLVASIGTKIDVAIAGMTITEERKGAVNFSTPYYDAVQYVIVPAGSKIATAADLEGKAIGVQLGTTGDFIVEEIKDATASQYNKAVDAVNDLMNGRVDAVIIDRNPALVFVEKFGDKVAALDGAQFGFETEEYAIAMPKGDDALVEEINNALEEVKADKTFDTLVSEYIGN